jgi:hypothetical protein
MIGDVVLRTKMENISTKGKETEKQERQTRRRLMRMSTDFLQVYQSME